MVDAVQRLTLPMLMQIVKQANERFFFFQAGRQLADQRCLCAQGLHTCCATMSAVTSVHTSAKVGWHDAQAGRQLADQRCLCVQGLHTYSNNISTHISASAKVGWHSASWLTD